MRDRWKRLKGIFQKILISDQKHENAAKELAIVFGEMGNFKSAISSLKKLITDNPKNRSLYHGLGLCLLTIGEFKDGWRSVETRWEKENKEISALFKKAKSIWIGKKKERRIVHERQGIGEDIIFLSLAPEVQEMCSSLAVYVDPRLQSLCRRAMPEINFVNDVDELQDVDCDYNLPLGSVPGLIRNDMRDFDRTVTGYLKADPERVESIRKELQLDGKTVIGISWKSFNTLNKTKSVQLRDMERICLQDWMLYWLIFSMVMWMMR